MLQSIEYLLLQDLTTDFKRSLYASVHWDEAVIGLIGERGVGKTTMMLQRRQETQEGFYFSADNTLIKAHGLFAFVFFLYENYDMQTFYIDEIHQYRDWTTELKNITDALPTCKVIFSGSSSLDLYKGILDLGRRVRFYTVYPLNFSEFLGLFYDVKIPTYSLEQILAHHKEISRDVGVMFKPTYFQEYIQYGYYPFAKERRMETFFQQMQVLIDRIVLEDLSVFVNFQSDSLDKLRKLFYFIAHMPPSEISYTSLGKKIELHKSVVENALILLAKIGVIALIPKFGNLTDRVRKEYKIFLGNPNIYGAYTKEMNKGTVRESFFVSQLRKVEGSELFLPSAGDFIVEVYNKRFLFEVGGKRKQQEKYPSRTFVVKDDIRISENSSIIPLWLFGCL